LIHFYKRSLDEIDKIYPEHHRCLLWFIYECFNQTNFWYQNQPNKFENWLILLYKVHLSPPKLSLSSWLLGAALLLPPGVAQVSPWCPA